MPQSSANTKCASHLLRGSVSSTDLNSSCAKPVGEDPGSQTTALSTKTRAQIANGPSNLTTYLRHNESHECIALGEATRKGESSMASKLAAWDARWKGMDGK